jgi:hypothetical protein
MPRQARHEEVTVPCQQRAQRRLDVAVRRRHVEDLGEEPVHVVRRLRRGPERELAVGGPVGDGGVLLHGQMRVALEVENVLAHEVLY